MTADIRTLPQRQVSQQQRDAMQVFSIALDAAIEEAKRAGLCQGFIVAVMHAAALSETQRMISMGDESA